MVLPTGGACMETQSNTSACAGLSMCFVGGMCLVPGIYFTRIAIKAYRREPGFDWSQFPDV